MIRFIKVSEVDEFDPFWPDLFSPRMTVRGEGISAIDFAIAALRPSIAQRGSERAPTVATGLKTISAPFRAKACQLSGWWRP